MYVCVCVCMVSDGIVFDSSLILASFGGKKAERSRGQVLFAKSLQRCLDLHACLLVRARA